MTCEKRDGHIDYVEFPVRDMKKTKLFYSRAFGWTFQDWGAEYASFEESGLPGGLRLIDPEARPSAHQEPALPLVILYASDLEAMEERILEAGGQRIGDILSFPGGRRFHFLDPSGNQLAVWSEA